MQAMILAAGLGTRLKPYSLLKPKPLFPVLNRPLLLATVERLKHSGFSKIIVNAHHLSNQIIDALAGISDVIVQEEGVILGTGGGLRKALDSLSEGPLLVTNGDIYHSVDYRLVYGTHLKSGAAVTMVLHDYPRFNSVCMDNHKITGFDGRSVFPLAYTGIQVIDPEILTDIPVDEKCCIIDHYQEMIQRGVDIKGLVLEETNWSDMGTPADYLALHKALLSGDIPVWDELARTGTENKEIDQRAFFEEGTQIVDWCCIGAAHIGSGAIMARSVVWDGAGITPGSKISDSIVVPESI